MSTRTQRTQSASILQAQRHRAEHAEYARRLSEAEAKLQRLNVAIQDRQVQLNAATSEWLKGIIRAELEQFSNEREDIKSQVAEFRQQLQQFSGRLDTVESRVTGVVARVDGIEVNSNAHATAIARLEAANGWLPIIGGAIATFCVYFFIEGVEWFRDDRFTTQNQWFWAVLIGAIVGIVLTCLPGNGRNIITRSTASAGGNVVVAQPPADQPAPAAGVTPPPPPPSGAQFSTVQAAAAASASSSN